MVESPTTLTGRSFNSGTVLGLKFARTSYSKRPIFAVPRRRDQILLLYGSENILGRQSLAIELNLVQINHDLTLFAAIGIGDHRARNGDELRPKKILAKVVQLRLRKALSRNAQLENRHA